jgi:hypothetical protein
MFFFLLKYYVSLQNSKLDYIFICFYFTIFCHLFPFVQISKALSAEKNNIVFHRTRRKKVLKIYILCIVGRRKKNKLSILQEKNMISENKNKSQKIEYVTRQKKKYVVYRGTTKKIELSILQEKTWYPTRRKLNFWFFFFYAWDRICDEMNHRISSFLQKDA